MIYMLNYIYMKIVTKAMALLYVSVVCMRRMVNNMGSQAWSPYNVGQHSRVIVRFVFDADTGRHC
jgi:hypothetical protein